MKPLCADDSVGPPHAKVGHCQAFKSETPTGIPSGFFFAQFVSVLSRKPAAREVGVHESLDAEKIRMHLSPLGYDLCRRIHVHDILDSTNTWLTERLRKIEGSAVQGSEVCLAESQTAGRGRRGRSWVSPASGNIYLSLSWRVLREELNSAAITLAIGLAVAEALCETSGVRIGIKWPNDLYVDNRKLGGILVEFVTRVSGNYWVAGIGVNLKAVELDAAANPRAIGMEEIWPEASQNRNRLAGAIIDNVLQTCVRYEEAGFAAMRDRWERHDVTRDKELEVHGADGRVMRGIGGGVDAGGRLRVLGADAEYWLDAGEVSLRLS